jgi:aryl-alcohol dehydrogenase-like predicted oxidoreductase
MPATAEGTKSYPHITAPSILGKTGWSVSPVGFGGYRIHVKVDEHRAALRLALESGCNIIDTSTNYGDGGSEKLVGEVLRDLFATGKFKREQYVVVSKVGYLQGENLKLAQQRKERGLAFQEITEYAEDCWHCLHPDFLKDQITRSLQRLQLDKIDVLLLHNPEYFLKVNGDHREYYRRIGEALKYLETEVAQGRIQHYGISSNTFPEPKEAEDFTSLEAIHDIVREAGLKHFSVIQFPFNLYEPDAAFECNNGPKTLFETAEAYRLGTLVNRPLNAFYGNKLIRLTEFPSHSDRDVEESLKNSFLEALQVESDYPAKDVFPAKKIAWAHILRHNFEKISDLEGWKNILAYQIEPSLDEAAEALSGNAEFEAWFEEYKLALEQLFTDLSDYLEELGSLLSKRIDKILDEACPALESSTTLSQKAIRVYRSVNGASSILVGMRLPEYVKDTLTFQPVLTPYEAMNALSAIQDDIEGGLADSTGSEDEHDHNHEHNSESDEV